MNDPHQPLNEQTRANRKHVFERSATKPKPISLNVDGIDDQLKVLACWVLWRLILAKGKWTKVPFSAYGNHAGASSTDTTTWAPFEDAFDVFECGGFDGIGIMFNGELVGFDFDNVRDPETGVIDPWAQDLIDELGGYAEVSPSGTGVKVIVRGKLPPGRRKFTTIGAEAYDRVRYFTITGHVMEGHERVEHRQAELEAVFAKLIDMEDAAKAAKRGDAKAGANGNGSRFHYTATAEPSAILTDDQLITKARNANVTGPKCQAFMRGEWSTGDYASQSEADLGFANLIVFWTDDADQVLRIVKVSGMWRDKWERADYARDTIGKAFAGRKNRYDPSYNRPRFEDRVSQAGDEPPPDSRAGVIDDMLDMAPAPDGPPIMDEPQPTPPKESIPLTDLGNGKRFAADHGEIVRFCHPWGKWLIWDSMRWRIDDTGRVMALAKQTVLGLFRWAEKQIKLLADDESSEAKIKIAKIKAILDFGLKSQHHNRLKAMVDLAKSEPGIPILPDSLDADPWALNCINGTLDLRTGKLHPHNQTDYLTKLCPVLFNPAATCPTFINTVNSILNNDKCLIEYVKRFLGYCLTGETREHAVPIAYGGGSNGKTLLFTIILETVGNDYADMVPPELLMETHGDQHPTIKADLFGKRLMIAAETKQGGRLNEERIKALSGSDRVKTRRMREDFWGFDPTHKLVVMTNHRPEIRGDDHGIWRRLALWPFTVRYWDADKGETGPPEFQADKTLPEKLRAEREGILAWLVAGCLDWQRHGMVMPAAVRAATAEYRSTEDQLGAFLAERCTLHTEFRVKASSLYETFKEWCKANGNRDMNATAFGMALAVRGIRRDDGRRWYLGVALAADEGQ